MSYCIHASCHYSLCKTSLEFDFFARIIILVVGSPVLRLFGFVQCIFSPHTAEFHILQMHSVAQPAICHVQH